MTRKMILVLAVLALLVPEAMLATTVTGKVTDSAGNAVSGASITFRLINIGRGNVARVSGSSMVAPKVVTATSAVDGTFTATLTGNDQITPSGTLYEVMIRGAGFTYGPFDYSITGASADLDSLTPVATFPNTPSQVSPAALPGSISAVALHDKGGEKFDVLSFGISTSNTATQNTTALNALLAIVAANHGGTIYFPPSASPYLLNPDITIPNSGSSPYANQYPIRIGGAVARQSEGNSTEDGYYDATGGSTLKFTSAAANADIVTLGQGNLQIDHLTLETTTCSPFILTTQTTLRVYSNLFIGAAGAPGSCNDALILGGTQAINSPTVNQNFGGFGTIIRGNTFKNIRRMVLAETYADDWFLEKNTYAATSGNPGYCAVEINDPGDKGSLGGYVENNRFEMTYVQCALKAVNATNPVFAFNDLEDFGSTPNATSVVDLTNTESAQVYSGFIGPPSGVPYVKAEDSQSDNYNFISNDPLVPTLFNRLNANNLTMTNSEWPASVDSSGNEISSHWKSSYGFYRSYTPSGGAQQDLYSVTVGNPDIVHFNVYGNNDSFFDGQGTYTFFKADNGSAELGNAVDQFALEVSSTDGSVKVDKWQRLTPHTLSAYPACNSATEGDQAAISDSSTNTWGATITGGGADHVLGYCDGANWTVAAK